MCRLLSTVGVARTLGDHDLLAKGCGIRVKEFLTPEPEVAGEIHASNLGPFHVFGLSIAG